MPGIVPMKVIKVGSTAQSRIAQACDRCRSKKIRCDGMTPCCSHCADVGFECKTSDKLSRRAFPRGYTESLEERVRTLEAEVKELKDLLDQKDEKLDLLSSLRSTHREQSQSTPLSSSQTEEAASQQDQPHDVVKVWQYFRYRILNQNAFCAGPSSSETFVGMRSISFPTWSDAAHLSRDFHVETSGKWDIVRRDQPRQAVRPHAEGQLDSNSAIHDPAFPNPFSPRM